MDQKTTPNAEVLIASASKKKYLIAMSLSSAHLDAFLEVARISSFSHAATTLLVNQHALSQRIKNLVTELGSALFIRESPKLRLTSAGQELPQYVKNRNLLENECLRRNLRQRAP